MKKFALLGFGGLGKIHFANLLEIEKKRGDICLTAICGADREALNKSTQINIGSVDLSSVDFSRFNLYDTVDELIENEELDFVISVLPTVMHAQTAIKFMERNIHVFSEKPMALSLPDCEKMVECAQKNNVCLMIGQCLRFEGAYKKLKEFVDNKTYGKPLRAEFMRYSQLPIWTYKNWILDTKQSGGCPLDFHCHDVDIINHIFGMPTAVNSFSTSNKVELESIFTTYTYPDMVITAKADWSLPQKYPFRAEAMVNFEKATVQISGENEITVYTDDEIIKPDYDKADAFLTELEEFIDCVLAGRRSNISTAQSVADSVRIVTSEIESAKNGKEVAL